MPKPPKPEIVRAEVIYPPIPGASPSGVLKEFVHRKVAEVLAERDEFLLEPFFRDAATAKEIRRLQNVSEREKWAVYFARHGCLVCEESRRPYNENGMCLRCRRRTYERLRAILRHADDVQSEQPAMNLDMEKLAREILGALPKRLAPPEPSDLEPPAPRGSLHVLLPEDLAFAPSNARLLDRLVKHQVAEVLTRDDLIFEPFFRSRQVAHEFRRLLTVPEWHKWSGYYERFGCLRCKNRSRRHGSTGLCICCVGTVHDRLKEIIKELSAQADGHTVFHRQRMLEAVEVRNESSSLLTNLNDEPRAGHDHADLQILRKEETNQ